MADGPFYVLEDVIEQTRKAAASARSLAAAYPADAKRHLSRAAMYDADLESLASQTEDDRITAEEDAKTDLQVIREALQLLNQKIDRIAFEVSARLEALEKK